MDKKAPFPVSIRIKKAEKPYFRIHVSKKELKRAVDRNKIKRRIRAICKDIVQKTLTIDVFVKKQALYISFQDLKNMIQSQIL